MLSDDLSNAASHVSAKACTQVQLLYVINPLTETEKNSLWKRLHLPSTPFSDELQNSSSCSTSLFLSCLYEHWTKTYHGNWYGGEPNSSVSPQTNFALIQILTCCLFLKAMPLLHKIKLLPTEPQKLHSFTTTDSEFFKCNTKLWA